MDSRLTITKHVMVRLVNGELVASLPDGRTMAHADALRLAELLLSEGLSAGQVQMPAWREGDTCAAT
jgi:hypothetical protein